jgi:hypothetical protein
MIADDVAVLDFISFAPQIGGFHFPHCASAAPPRPPPTRPLRLQLLQSFLCSVGPVLLRIELHPKRRNRLM